MGKSISETIKEVMENRKITLTNDTGKYIHKDVALQRELDSANKLIRLMVENNGDPNVKEVFDYMLICARDISFRELVEENEQLKKEITTLKTKLSQLDRIRNLIEDIEDELY